MTSSRLHQGRGGRARRARSLRKDARERYRAAATAAGLDASAASACADAATETPLTGRVRALYEGSVTPVREIARLVGVSERTLYKYVQKGGWRRRHACPARDAAVAAANAGRAATPGPGFAPAKGAGGRFIRREDVSLPIPRGLKALDPQGAQRAAEACERAGVIAAEAVAAAVADAQARAAREQAAREAAMQMRTFERLNDVFVDLAKFRAGLGDARGGGAATRADRLAARLQQVVLTQIARALAPRGEAPD